MGTISGAGMRLRQQCDALLILGRNRGRVNLYCFMAPTSLSTKTKNTSAQMPSFESFVLVSGTTSQLARNSSGKARSVRARLHSLPKNSSGKARSVRARLHSLRKNSSGKARSVRARLHSLRKNSLASPLQRLCNKGTTSVGPIKPIKSMLGFSPCNGPYRQSLRRRTFSASCSTVPQPSQGLGALAPEEPPLTPCVQLPAKSAQCP